MTLSHISRYTQQQLGITASITATFIEDMGDVPDKICLNDGRLIDLTAIVHSQTTLGEVQVEMHEMLDDFERSCVLNQIAGRSQAKIDYESDLLLVGA